MIIPSCTKSCVPFDYRIRCFDFAQHKRLKYSKFRLFSEISIA